VRLKVSLNGVLDALDEADDRISQLEVLTDALNTVRAAALNHTWEDHTWSHSHDVIHVHCCLHALQHP
jgi:hypothetical protein